MYGISLSSQLQILKNTLHPPHKNWSGKPLSWLWVATYVHEYAFKAGGENDLIHKLLF